MKKNILIFTVLTSTTFVFANSYKIVDTGQKNFFGNSSYISKPSSSDKYFGQDASYIGNQFSYTNNNNGTITDNVTKLMWSKSIPDKLTLDEALSYAKSSKLGGYSDWRIPSIKELYSLINFNGRTGKGNPSSSYVPRDAEPYLDTRYFDFEYPTQGRFIDAQYWTSTDYVSTTMNGNETFFGVNFADGRIKGYPKYKRRNGSATYYLRLVRDNKDYGKNAFKDNKNGTISDLATNLKWMQDDSKNAMNWNDSLSYCENLNFAGISTWRLPNAKELQSIVDYTRSPDTTNSAAINAIFNASSIKNEGGQKDFPSYWSSTTHLDGKNLGEYAVYVSFGRALGYMGKPGSYFSSKKLMDVHGAGAQRSDPKSGSISRFSEGHGPQGDVVRVKNYVRCVSDSYTKVDESTYKKVLNETNEKRRDIRDAIMPPYEQNRQEPKKKIEEKNMFLTFDKNQDGKISYEEAPIMMQRNFNKHDLNGDGFIYGKELDTLPKHKPRR